MIKSCIDSLEECRIVSTKKYEVSISILEKEKFDEIDRAKEFYNTWKGLTQTDLDTEFRLFDYNVELDSQFPIVLFALKIIGPDGQLPLVAICNKNGDLIRNSKIQLFCGS